MPKYFKSLTPNFAPCIEFPFNILPKITPPLLRDYLENRSSHRTKLSIILFLKYILKSESAVYLFLLEYNNNKLLSYKIL